MLLDRPSEFLVPDELLPDGTLTFKEHTSVNGLVEALREYDPRISLCFNNQAKRWEIWRQCEDNKPRRLASMPKGAGFPDRVQTLAQLQAYDTRLGYDPYEAMVAAEDADTRERDRVFGDESEELADKLHFGMTRDLHAHAPATRPMPLGGPS